MASSDSGDQASARGMSLLLLILYSPVFSRAFIFMNFMPSAHTYICTAVVLAPIPVEFSLHVFITSHID